MTTHTTYSFIISGNVMAVTTNIYTTRCTLLASARMAADRRKQLAMHDPMLGSMPLDISAFPKSQ